MRGFKFRSGQRNLVAVFQRDDGFLPGRGAAGLRSAFAAGFAAHAHRVDPGDLDLEQFLHGLPDLRLGGEAVGDDGVLVERTFLDFRFSLVVQDRLAGLVAFKETHLLVGLPPWRVPFSVRRTVLMISKGFMLFLVQTGFDLFKRAPGEEEFVRAQHVVGVERIAGGQRNERQVARSQNEIFVNTGGNNQRGSV